MKTILKFLVEAVMSANVAYAQTYSIDWSTIDGGGGTSTGGVYSVSGTIGQPDAGGPMTNGQYSTGRPSHRRTDAHDRSRYSRQCHDLVDAKYTRLYVAGDLEPVADQLGELVKRRDKSRHSSGHPAEEVLSVVQTLASRFCRCFCQRHGFEHGFALDHRFLKFRFWSEVVHSVAVVL